MRLQGEGRAPGLHLGSVIRDAYMAIDTYKNADGSLLRMQEGFIWEKAVEYMAGGMKMDDAISLAFKRYLWGLESELVTQIQLERDGIQMTPDAYDPVKAEIVSYKHTRRSLKKAMNKDAFELNFWTWMMAEKSYCLAASCDSCRFVVLWAAGDYSKGVGSAPRALQATLTWTAEELIENWNAVLAHAKGRQNES